MVARLQAPTIARAIALLHVLIGTLGCAAAAQPPRAPARAAFESFLMLSAGPTATCVVRASGRVQCWGGCSPNPCTWREPRDLVSIDTGMSVFCGVSLDGTGACWPRWRSDSIGASLPFSGIAEIHVSLVNACARTTAGEAFCWLSHVGSDPLAGLAPLPATGVESIVIGGPRVCVQTSDRTAAWELAGGYLPAAPWGSRCAAGVLTGQTEIGCELVEDGIRCWDAIIAQQERIYTVDDPVEVDLGRVPCVRDRAGRVTCLGSIDCDGGPECRFPPEPHQRRVIGLPGAATSLSVGAQHACAIIEDGSAWCWGSNRFGQLGDGTTQSTSTPVAMLDHAP